MSDGVKVVWSYRPDDRSKQGKTETLPPDEAALKVREGLAYFADEKRPSGASEDSAAGFETDTAVTPGTVVTNASSGKSAKS